MGKLEQSKENGLAVPALHSWKAFKELFKSRYVSVLTLSKQVKKMRNMHQQSKETVMDFRDRVDLQTYDLFESAWTAKEDTEAEIKADLASREKAREIVANVLFASGLNDNIRDKACNMATKDMSTEEFSNVARRVEQTEKDKKL